MGTCRGMLLVDLSTGHFWPLFADRKVQNVLKKYTKMASFVFFRSGIRNVRYQIAEITVQDITESVKGI